MPLLKTVHPFVAEILDGNHDEILSALAQAIDVRRRKMQAESGVRPRARVRMTALAKDLAGREGIVLKVNAKTVSVALDCPTCGACDPATAECETCFGVPDEWRVSPAFVEAVPAAVAS